MSQAPALQLRVVTDSTEFESLRSVWTGLWRQLPVAHVFLSFDWCWNAWHLVARSRGYGLRLVIGEIDGRIVLIWPLMQLDGVLRMLSSETVEYRDVLIERSDRASSWLDQAWSFVKSSLRADVFMLQNLRHPSVLDAKLQELGTGAAVSTGWCPVIRLDRFVTWAAYEATLPRRLVSDQRRQWKRLRQAAPGLAFRLLDRADMIGPTIDWVGLHKVRWAASRQGTTVWFESPDKRRLLRAAAERALLDGNLVFGVLCDGDTMVAAGWGYISGEEFLYHAFAYDAAYATYSPARLLLERLIQHCFERGVRVFDFMPGDQGYKRIWATDYVRELSHTGPLSRRGAWLIRLSRWKLAVGRTAATRQVFELLPASVRRGVRRRWRALQMVDFVLSRKPPAPPGHFN